MKISRKSSRNAETKQKMTLDAIKVASKSVKTATALSKIVGGTLSDCHLVGTGA